MHLNKKLKADLAENFGLALEDRISKEQLIAALTRRIEDLLAASPDQLCSLLYRLDISERKIKQALEETSDVARQLALLIFDRQIEKAISRKAHPGARPDDELAW